MDEHHLSKCLPANSCKLGCRGSDSNGLDWRDAGSEGRGCRSSDFECLECGDQREPEQNQDNQEKLKADEVQRKAEQRREAMKVLNKSREVMETTVAFDEDASTCQ